VIGTSQLSGVGGLLLNHESVADESSYDLVRNKTSIYDEERWSA
jgi:hypothetical protein